MLNQALEGKKILVTGVANQRSIAWGIAQCLSQCGARLGFTYQGDRIRTMVEPLVESVNGDFLVPCDVSEDADVDAVFDKVREEWGEIDGIVHAIAFAKREDLAGDFVSTSRDGFALAHDISSYSLTRLCQGAADLMTDDASVVALSYLGGERVVSGYNVMGVAKASLEMSVRYLAADLGPRGVRVNAISAGPVKTLAARGVAGFTQILDVVEERAPMRRNVSLEEIGWSASFLLSRLSGGITGEVVHVDSGFHVLGL
ncbi:MAG: enoyl-ACP reductase [Planctomycetota bacterium]